MLRRYLRPVDIVPCAEAAAELVAGKALRLAGGPLAFRAVQVTERLGTRIERFAARPVEAFAEGGDADALTRLSAARRPIAGVGFDRPRLMGILNVTPDSFSDGGESEAPAAAVARGQQLAAAGADVIDIGGESTRPGAAPVAPAAELERVLPVLQGLAGIGRRLSIDTRNSATMQSALAAGADLVNDVSALCHDPASLDVVAGTGAPVVLMHAQGVPATMQIAPHYDDVLLDVYDFLEQRIAACEAAGIARDRIIVDPGIGFGKTMAHNLCLLRGLSLLHGLGCAILVGVSRKGFIGRLSGVKTPAARTAGSLAAELHALSQGAQMLRVHDVAAVAQAVAVWNALAGIVGDGHT